MLKELEDFASFKSYFFVFVFIHGKICKIIICFTAEEFLSVLRVLTK